MKLKELKEKLDSIFDVSSYGYKVNKWFMRSAFIIMLILFAIIGFVDGVDSLQGDWWFECPADAPMPCLNPYYDPMSFDCDHELCASEFVFQGVTYGHKPSWLAQSFSFICVGLFALALLLNHLIYNRKVKL